MIVVKLFARRATETVNNFVELARRGFYDGLTFHHVIGGLLVQTGKPTDMGLDPSSYTLRHEFHPELRHDSAGIVAMANADTDEPAAHGTQFYLTLAPAPHLDGMNIDGTARNCNTAEVSCHTVFGKVIKRVQQVSALNWKQHLNEIKIGDTIRSIEIIELPPGQNPADFQSHDCAGGSAIRDAINNADLVNDCDVLLNIKDTLLGDAELNWNDDHPITFWDGIEVARDDQGAASLRVRDITLVGFGLNGSIPAEIVQLDGLMILNLADNDISGAIPPELGNLKELVWLELSGNRLSGEIPRELGALRELIVLALARNELSGEIPLELGKLRQHFEILELDHNLLTGEVPPELIYGHTYGVFGIEGNRLGGCIPKELEAAETRLGNLELCSGAVPSDSMKPEATDHKEPEDCANGVVVLQPELNPGLVSDCRILLQIADTLTGDRELNWSTKSAITDWQGIYLANEPIRVVELHLGDFGLNGQIPAGIGNLDQLLSIGLGYNELSGEIPADIAKLKRLAGLGLQNNNLEGEIPTEIGQMKQLEGISLASNNLSGHLPTQLGELENLLELDLSHNEFSGELPENLTRLTKLVYLNLEGNDLSGCAPREFDQPDFHLGDLEFCSDQIVPTDSASSNGNSDETGRFATEAALCSNGFAVPDPGANRGLVHDCSILLASRDVFRGDARLYWTPTTPIFDWHGVVVEGDEPRVVGLYVYDSNLSGRIPSELAMLTKLRDLVLPSNRLTGAIPPELGSLSELENLILFDNQLGGEIPNTLGELTNLEVFDVTNNQLTGEIPTNIGRLDKLKTFAVGYNLLEGSIPDLSALTELEVFGLSVNRLSGPFPAELGDIETLQVIAVSDNYLEGELPSNLGKLERLYEFEIIGNELVGCVPEGLKSVDAIAVDLGFCDEPPLTSLPATIHQGGTDLVVTYIERLPRYERYHVAYDESCASHLDLTTAPVPCQRRPDAKRWPDAGEPVQLVAHIWNMGDATSESFEYELKIADVVEVGVHAGLGAGARDKLIFDIAWPQVDENPVVTFTLDPKDEIPEILENNNKVIDWIKGYTIGFYFNLEAYESLIRSNREGEAIQSPEHWVHSNILRLNELLEQADLNDRVRVEQFYISDGIYAPPHLQRYLDGWWQLSDNFPIYTVAGHRKRPEVDYGLLHELLHQLGVIDLYWMLVEPSQVELPGRCGIENGQGKNECFRFDDHVNDIMSAGPHVIGAHTAGGLRSNYGKRRGYYGEYLYDTPERTELMIVDEEGNALPSIRLFLYQLEYEDGATTVNIDATAEIEVITDENGIAVLPNHGITGTVTPTRHQLRPNPFGTINVVGTNGLFLIEMSNDKCTNYEWLSIVDLNLAYWDGHTEKAVFEKEFSCPVS